MCVECDIVCKQKAVWKLLPEPEASKSFFPSESLVSIERLSLIYLFFKH